MSEGKRTIRVFYSSPFRGMERERELLTAVYWPRLSHACSAEGYTFVPIDFRWGITEESVFAASAVSICLDQVNASDVFVGFFGARYGWHGLNDKSLQASIDKALPSYPWLEEYRDRSITEMEFLEARLKSPETTKPAALFFRDPEYDAKKFLELKDSKDAPYFQAIVDGPLSEELLNNLKTRSFEYAQTLNVESMDLAPFSCQEYSDPEAGALMMYNITMDILKKNFLKSEAEKMSEADRCFEGQRAFVKTQASLGAEFLGRQNEQKELIEKIGLESCSRLVVLGEEGTGKTALLINYLTKTETPDRCLLVYYSMSAYPGANRIIPCLQYLAVSLLRQLSKPEEYDQIYKITSVTLLLQKVNELCDVVKTTNSKIVIFLIDELDKIDSQQTTDIPLGYLPVSDHYKTIVSTKISDTFHLPRITEDKNVEVLTLTEFEISEAMQAAKSGLELRGKSLSQACMEIIESCEQIKNFMFLKILLELLFVHGQHYSLEEKVRILCKCKTIQGLFTLFLDQIENDMKMESGYVEGSATSALFYLILSQEGLMETEIRKLANWDSRIYTHFFTIMRPFLIDNRGTLSMKYSHFSKAAREKMGSEDCGENKFRNDLADFYWRQFLDAKQPFREKNFVTKRLAHELPPVLLATGRLDQLIECLLDLNFFCTSIERGSVNIRDRESTVDMHVYKYAHFLKQTKVEPDEIVAKFKKNVEMDIVTESCSRFGSMKVCKTERMEYLVTPLCEFHDFFEEAFGMPGMTCDIMQLSIQIQKGVISWKREVKKFNNALKDEIYLAEMYNRLGTGLYYGNDFDEAILSLNKALAIKKTLRPRTDLIRDIETRIATTLHSLGNVYKAKHEYDKALPCFEEAADIYRKAKSNYLWSTLDGVASCYFFKKDFATAEELYREVVDHYSKNLLHVVDSNIAGYICNLANAVRRNGKLDEARELYKTAWSIQSKLLGENHISIAITCQCLGNLELMSKNFEDAVFHYKRAYEIFKTTVGFDSYQTALAAENIAMGYCKLEDLQSGQFWFFHGGELLESLGLLHYTMPWMNGKFLRFFEERGNDDACDKVKKRMEKAGIPLTQ